MRAIGDLEVVNRIREREGKHSESRRLSSSSRRSRDVACSCELQQVDCNGGEVVYVVAIYVYAVVESSILECPFLLFQLQVL